MCGICGFCGDGSLDDLKRMNDAHRRRGPDAEGTWSAPEKGLYLGHRRLSIIDINDGAQPMVTRDGSLVVTFNGEIYNHEELRRELEKSGHQFTTHHSDTEVLLHGYREWGGQLPAKLNGMWAFAIYDRQHERLFLSRDRFGKKPLFYTQCGDTFIFASELTSLRSHPAFSHPVSVRSLQKYFAYNYVPAPGSLYESVYKLPAGHNLIYSISNRTLHLERYWEFRIEPFDVIPADPEAVWGEQLRDLLDRAVKRRLIADVPLGVFLSGGVDSTAVTCFAAKHTGAGALSTFSIGFEEPSFDESEYSDYAARTIGTNHHHHILSLNTAKQLLPAIAAMLDEPFGDNSLLPTYLLCRECRRFVTVALGGDGADELFAGYDPVKALKAAQIYDRFIPKPVHEAVRLLIGRMPVSHVNMSLDFRLKRTLRGLSYGRHYWNPVWQGALEPRELSELFSEPVDPSDIYSEAIDCWDACAGHDIIDRTLQFYTRLYLQDDILVKIDRASMMNSLEVRAPFLDIDLVDFVRKIPSSYKYRNGQTKYILKKALEPLLPGKILYRKKKGFGVPVGKWFAEGALALGDTPPDPRLSAPFFSKQVTSHLRNNEDNRGFLWNSWLLQEHVNNGTSR